MLVITADHGMAHRADYGYHNREPLPLLAKRFGSRGLGGIKPGAGKTLADAGYIISQFFGCEREFLDETGTEKLLALKQ
jgi:phosphopentomutase